MTATRSLREQLLQVWHEWHYTDGWGSLGTITVATIAILASIWYNRRTLGQAQTLGSATIAITNQQRTDLRYDVLRKEISQWLTMVSEVERVCGELVRRLQEIDSIDDYGGSPLVEFVDVDGPSIGALHSLIGRNIHEPMTNLTTQGIQIQMLTSEYSVLVNMHLITQALIGKIQNLYAMPEKVRKNANSPAGDCSNFFPVFLAIAQDYQYTRQINVSRADLMAYVIRRFNPAAVGALVRVHREFPDVIGNLQPTGIFEAPQAPQAATGESPSNAESDDPVTAPIRRISLDSGGA